MKVDIVISGPYNSENIGDFVMLFGLLILLSKVDENINKIYILTKKDKHELYSILEDELLYLNRKYRGILKKIHIVGYRNLPNLLFPKKIWIFGGGFILLPHIFKKFKKRVVLVIKYMFIPILARIFGNKVIYYSVDGLPSFLARVPGMVGKVYTRSWILHKRYEYNLILDIGHLYFEELNEVISNVKIENSKSEYFDENNPDIHTYKPREFYRLVLTKNSIITHRYHTLLFSLLNNKTYTVKTNDVFNRLRLKSLIATFNKYKIKIFAK